jgi:hypothetical protein
MRDLLAIAAAAPRPASPTPPANTGLSNRVSRGRRDFEGAMGFVMAELGLRIRKALRPLYTVYDMRTSCDMKRRDDIIS